MTDLLTPDEVREMELKAIWPYEHLGRLCQDYLTLWDENEVWKDRTKELVERLQMWEEHG